MKIPFLSMLLVLAPLTANATYYRTWSMNCYSPTNLTCHVEINPASKEGTADCGSSGNFIIYRTIGSGEVVEFYSYPDDGGDFKLIGILDTRKNYWGSVQYGPTLSGRCAVYDNGGVIK